VRLKCEARGVRKTTTILMTIMFHVTAKEGALSLPRTAPEERKGLR